MTPGQGRAEVGVKWQAGARPYGYGDVTQRLAPGLDLFGLGELHDMNDWRAQGGLRWTWGGGP